MNTKALFISVAIAGCAAAPPIISAKCLDAARLSCASAESLLQAAQRDAAVILELRSARERIAANKRPEEHVLAQVNSILAESGIPSRRLQSVRPEADVALPASRPNNQKLRRQSVSISLQQISISELGRFLTSWRQAGLIWSPSRIELNKSRSTDHDQYDATIVISAVYLGGS